MICGSGSFAVQFGDHFRSGDHLRRCTVSLPSLVTLLFLGLGHCLWDVRFFLSCSLFLHEKKRGLSLLMEEAANPKGFLFSEFGITSSTKLLPKPSRILFGRVSKKGRSGRFLELFRQFATEQKFTITLEKWWQLNITCSASISVFNFSCARSSKTLLACSFLVFRKERPIILKGPSPHRNRNRKLKKLRRRRRGQRRLKNDFIFYLRISRYPKVIYYVYLCQSYHETESRTHR